MEGYRTYLVGAGVILHQLLKFAGVDISDQMISEAIDAILGLGAIFFRWKAAVQARLDVKTALYTPVPKDGGQ